MKMPTQEVVIWVMETKRRRGGKGSIIFYLLTSDLNFGFFRVRSGFLGDDSCLESAAVKKRKVKENIKRIVSKEVADDGEEIHQENVDQKEMLEEMGVNVLSDNSNSCDISFSKLDQEVLSELPPELQHEINSHYNL